LSSDLSKSYSLYLIKYQNVIVLNEEKISLRILFEIAVVFFFVFCLFVFIFRNQISPALLKLRIVVRADTGGLKTLTPRLRSNTPDGASVRFFLKQMLDSEFWILEFGWLLLYLTKSSDRAIE